MTLFAPSDRDATLARVLELLEADPRIEAAVIDGSMGASTADRWSDIDVATLVADAQDCERVADDWTERLYRDLPVAHHYRTNFGSTIVPGFLLNDGLEVDLSFTPASEFSVWAPVRVAFDRTGTATRAAESPVSWTPTPDWPGEAGFVWHDILHACVAANRNQPWRALIYLQRVRTRTLGLACERHGWDADEFARVDELPAPERDPLLASLVSALEPVPLLRAIEVATHAFLDELRRGDQPLADRLAPPLLTFVEASLASASGAVRSAGER